MVNEEHTILISTDEHVQASPLLEQLIEQAAVAVLAHEGAGPCEVSVHLTDDTGIRSLNRTYRNMDQATDVLSFGSDDDDTLPDGTRLLGDIIISLERATEQAGEYGHSYEREVAFLVVHGVLHLLGYDHEEDEQRREMRAREEGVLARLGLQREG